MMKKRTKQEITFAALNSWTDEKGNADPEVIAHQVNVLAVNTRHLYDEIVTNKRRKTRNIAIEYLMYWVDVEIEYSVERGYYATNEQVMKWDKTHNGLIEKVLGLVSEQIETT